MVEIEEEEDNFMPKEKIIITIVFCLFLILISCLYIWNHKKEEGYDFEIHFFNAGKADAIILSNNGKYMMIDTGEESLSKDILKYLEENNITRLEYLIITHFDKDHVGSASEILNNIEIGEVFQSNVPKESEYYTKYLEALQNKNITPTTISGNLERSLEDLIIQINGPEIIYDSNESNNSSLIVSIIDDNNKFLFMGDAENARIKDFLKINEETYDFLKVPYHGNTLKRLEKLIETKEIKYAVITSSEEEKESDDTIDTLNKYKVSTYLTRKGSITVLSNGENIIIKQ